MKINCPCGTSWELSSDLDGLRFRCSCGRILTVGSSHAYETPSPQSRPETTPDHQRQAGKGAESKGWASRGRVAALAAAAVWIFAVVIFVTDETDTPGSTSSRPATNTGYSIPPADVDADGSSSEPENPFRDLYHESSSEDGGGLGATPSPPDPCPRTEIRRPPSGRELAEFADTGYGELTIDNGTDLDAVALLQRAYGTPYRAIFIRANDVGRFTRVAPGRYRLRFQHGEGWMRTREFCQVRGTSEFVEPLVFEEEFDGNQILYDAMEVTLHNVVGGTARAADIPPSDFTLPQ